MRNATNLRTGFCFKDHNYESFCLSRDSLTFELGLSISLPPSCPQHFTGLLPQASWSSGIHIILNLVLLAWAARLVICKPFFLVFYDTKEKSWCQAFSVLQKRRRLAVLLATLFQVPATFMTPNIKKKLSVPFILNISEGPKRNENNNLS